MMVDGYVWLLHHVHKVVSLEERTKLWADKR